MMKNKKFFLSITAFLLAAGLLGGCGRFPGTDRETTLIGASTAEMPSPNMLIKDYLKEVICVRPELATETEISVLQKLRVAIGSSTMPMSDGEDVSPRQGQLLIGNTNRQLSVDAREKLCEKPCALDFLICYDHGNFAIVGGSDLALDAAADYLIETMMNQKMGDWNDGAFYRSEVVYPQKNLLGLGYGSIYVKTEKRTSDLCAARDLLESGIAQAYGYPVVQSTAEADTIITLCLDDGDVNTFTLTYPGDGLVELSAGHCITLMNGINQILTGAYQTKMDSTQRISSDIELQHGDRKLIWYDEFNGTELDVSKWKRSAEQPRQNGQGWWRDSQSYLDGEGHLILGATIETDHQGNKTPIGGAVETSGKFSQTYGYFECRMKLNSQLGFWGAFWMMCGNVMQVDNSGRDGIEIDIIESGEIERKRINHALHWDGYGTDHKVNAYIVEKNLYDGQFHLFALEWTKDAYVFYVDGEETVRVTDQNLICEKPGYIILSTEFGSWAGKYDESKLPDCVVVDWVRVYQ